MKTFASIYFINRAWFLTLSFVTGMTLSVACGYNDQPRAEHCQNNDGDAYCKRKYPDDKEHRWYCLYGNEVCWSEGKPKDGCIAEIPKKKDECYKPCGLMTAWEECLGPAQTTSTGEVSSDTSTETTDTAGTTESESGTSETSGGVCGNGVQEGMEACDDGNDENSDDCLDSCEQAKCGDGQVWNQGMGTEVCDDGNQVNTDACIDGCKVASCGDGYVWTDMEACDDGNQDNGDGCSAECKDECGDGTWNKILEECDDNNQDNGDGCSAACKDEKKVVFVTSMPTPSGNLGGLLGADGICQMAADSVPLQGTFRAWLSDDSGSPSMWTNERTLPYVRMDGKEVAEDWADLVDMDELVNPINVTESNMPVGNNIFVWTNTTPEGSLKSEMTDCTGWTNEDGLDIGGQGLSSQTNSTWTQTQFPAACSLMNALHLYCFEQ